jgi:hypothetical protein
MDETAWQAPTLTIAAQAFLLTVLTDTTIDDTARFWILVAGVAGCVAAILSLIRLLARERLYSEAIGYAADKAKIPDPRPFELKTKPVSAGYESGPLDRAVRWLGTRRQFPAIYLFWVGALALFIVADIVAYCATT